jgi:FAD/FMN-containing dehydrogenase
VLAEVDMAEKSYEDYGHLFRKDPERVETPRSIEALSRLLRACNDDNTPVTLRNTGHSTNGQTLTNRVQLNLSGLLERRFDRERMEITVGPGNSWNSVLKTLDFPKYCLPLFPNNPGQRIHIGGTAGVGGVGYYGSRVGGFWNAVRSITLVTMEGKVIECSRQKNFQLMRYSLAGFGRTGVIAGMTVSVVPSKAEVVGMLLVYRCHDDYEHDLLAAMEDPDFDGVAGQEDIPSRRSREEGMRILAEDESVIDIDEALGNPDFASEQMSKLDLKILTVIKEIDAEDQVGLRNFVRRVRFKYPCGIMLFMKLKDSNLDVSLDIATFKKKELVYFSPRAQSFWIYLVQRVCQFLTRGVFRCLSQPQERSDTMHPWNDCIVPVENYQKFMAAAKDIIAECGFEKNISKQSIFHGLVNVDSFVTFLIRKINPEPDPALYPEGNEFPLALDLPGNRKVSLGLAIMPDLLAEERDRLGDLLRMCDRLTDLTYRMGGRRYLYGYHRLTVEQLELQYGAPTIREWNRIRRELDPKGLLNAGVLGRELDEFA